MGHGLIVLLKVVGSEKIPLCEHNKQSLEFFTKLQ